MLNNNFIINCDVILWGEWREVKGRFICLVGFGEGLVKRVEFLFFIVGR